jgi:hypothetical protein
MRIRFENWIRIAIRICLKLLDPDLHKVNANTKHHVKFVF